MKNVLIVMPSILPVPAVNGGAVETLVENLIKENENEKKLKLSVFTNLTTKARHKLEGFPLCNFFTLKESVLMHLEELFFKKKYFIRKILVIRQVRYLLENNNFDAVVLENAGFLLKIFAKKTLIEKYKGKIFFHLHNKIPLNADRQVLKHCNLLTVSKFIMNNANSFMGGDYVFGGSIVKNGIDSTLFSKKISQEECRLVKKELNIAEDDKVVIFVGRIVPGKGVDKLIDAINSLHNDKIVLIIIGSTYFAKSYRSKYEKFIEKKCNIIKNQIRRIGYIDNSCLWKYYGVADVAVFPSIWDEPAGLTMVEAAMSGLPVITTNVGGIPEYMTPPLAILLNNDENLVFKIKENILKILSKGEKMEKIAKEYQSTFSMKRMYSDFVKSLE